MRMMKWVVVLPSASLILGGAKGFSDPKKPACQVAKEWVTAHADRLPATYDEFSELSPILQRNVYPALTDAQRTGLWRAKLTRIQNRPGLSAEQEAVIEFALSRLGVQVDGNLGTGALAGGQAWARARNAFGDSLAVDFFANLTPQSVRVASAAAVGRVPDNPCNCDSIWFDMCPSPTPMGPTNESCGGWYVCAPTKGCGFWGGSTCTGTCGIG